MQKPPTMSSSSNAQQQQKQDQQDTTNKPIQSVPQLGALEEDDEFEEFAAEGEYECSGNECIAWSLTLTS